MVCFDRNRQKVTEEESMTSSGSKFSAQRLKTAGHLVFFSIDHMLVTPGWLDESLPLFYMHG